MIFVRPGESGCAAYVTPRQKSGVTPPPKVSTEGVRLLTRHGLRIRGISSIERSLRGVSRLSRERVSVVVVVFRKGQLLITRTLLGHYHAELHKAEAPPRGHTSSDEDHKPPQPQKILGQKHISRAISTNFFDRHHRCDCAAEKRVLEYYGACKTFMKEVSGRVLCMLRCHEMMSRGAPVKR